jgi:hypothetical protein
LVHGEVRFHTARAGHAHVLEAIAGAAGGDHALVVGSGGQRALEAVTPRVELCHRQVVELRREVAQVFAQRDQHRVELVVEAIEASQHQGEAGDRHREAGDGGARADGRDHLERLERGGRCSSAPAPA